MASSGVVPKKNRKTLLGKMVIIGQDLRNIPVSHDHHRHFSPSFDFEQLHGHFELFARTVHDRIRSQHVHAKTVGHRQVKSIQRPHCRRSAGHPLARLTILFLLNRHDVIQLLLAMTAKQLLDALRIVLRQFLAPHLLCERRVQLDVRQPARNGSIKRRRWRSAVSLSGSGQ